MPRTLFGLSLDWAKANKQARTLLDSLEATDLDVTARVGVLSVGNRQRVEIAKALSRQARILILDEPTAVLTQHDTERLFSVIRRLREQNVAIIYISHRLEEIFMLADRVTVLRDGKLVGVKSAKETNEGELIRMMVGRALAQEPAPHTGELADDLPVVLRAKGLARRPLLKNASIELRAGEILGMAGVIGAGRTELAPTHFCIAPPGDRSNVLDWNQDGNRRPEQAVKPRIAYVAAARRAQKV